MTRRTGLIVLYAMASLGHAGDLSAGLDPLEAYPGADAVDDGGSTAAEWSSSGVRERCTSGSGVVAGEQRGFRAPNRPNPWTAKRRSDRSCALIALIVMVSIAE